MPNKDNQLLFYTSEFVLENKKVKVYHDIEDNMIVVNNIGLDSSVSFKIEDAENVALMIQHLVKAIPT